MKSSKLFHHFEIIGMFWKWHLTFLMALGCVSWSSCGKVPEEDQWPSWPSQRELVMLPSNWSMLGAVVCSPEGWGNAPCPWGTRVCQSRIHPSLNSLTPFFVHMTWGRWRDERRASPCSTRVGNEEIWGRRNLLTGRVWVFPDYRLS